MKCPKCGYVSFDYLDQCKGCGRDLVQFKSDMGITVFTPGTINILRYVEGMEGAVEKPKEAEFAAAVEEVSADEFVEKLVKQSETEAASEVGEITLPEEIAKPAAETADMPPRLIQEKNEKIELTLEPIEGKEEITVSLDGEENKVEPTKAKEKEELSEVDEISLTLEDIAEFDEEKTEN